MISQRDKRMLELLKYVDYLGYGSIVSKGYDCWYVDNNNYDIIRHAVIVKTIENGRYYYIQSDTQCRGQKNREVFRVRKSSIRPLFKLYCHFKAKNSENVLSNWK